MLKNTGENPIAAEVVNRLLTDHHGLWFQYISECKGGDGRVRSKLSGEPHITLGFCHLYGFRDESDFKEGGGIRKLVAKEDWLRAARAIRNALDSPGAPSNHTLRCRTREGKEKIVEVYLRRIKLSDGRNVLASFHSDLTAASDWQRIYRVVLDELPGFVFVKQWDPAQEAYVFRYANSVLSNKLGLRIAEDINGRADRDFFSSSNQIRAFRETDDLISQQSGGLKKMVVEEELTLKGSETHEGETLRLLTIKMPFSMRDSAFEGSQRDMVLGISMDVTPVTDMLRAVSEESDVAIYIKDSLKKYQLVNKAFVRLMGLSRNDELIGKRFEELSLNKSTAEFIDEIRQEDDVVLKGRSVTHVRTARFHDGREWLTEKKPFAPGKATLPTHILGIARPLFGGAALEMLDKIPQCVSVKRYDEHASSPEDRFKIVWANTPFLNRHKIKSMGDVVGFTDKDLWPQRLYGNQFNTYVTKDQCVVDIGIKLGEKCSFKDLVGELVSADCWEFREKQIDVDRKETVLQTSKWPEYIGGRWFVVVVYSDVTKGDAEKQMYHDMTVHTIRGAFSPVSAAITHINNAITAPVDQSEHLTCAVNVLRDASENINWFLAHHLELLRMQIKPKYFPVGILSQILRSELDKSMRSSRWPFAVTLESADEVEFERGTGVNVDLTFIQATISEFVRNASKAIGRRSESMDNFINDKIFERDLRAQGWEDLSPGYRGELKASVAINNYDFVITIADNGAATANVEERETLRQKFDTAKATIRAEQLRLGLAFCVLTIEKHQGTVDLQQTKGWTQFSLHLPLAG